MWNMGEVLTEGALCNALDAIATWQQAGADAAEVPLPPHVQDAMEAVEQSHEELRAKLAEAEAEVVRVRTMLRKVLTSRPRGCRERTVLEMLPAATALEARGVERATR